jgi:phage tail-like protein
MASNSRKVSVPNLPQQFDGPPKGKKPVDRDEPWGGHYFSFELNDREIAHFQECSSIKTTAEVFIIQEGGYNQSVHKRVGQSKWSTVTLKYATTATYDMMEWRDSYLKGSGFKERANTRCAIVLRGLDGAEKRRFTLIGAWPVSWEGPQLAAGGSALAIETIEIAFDRVLIDAKGDNPPPPPPPPPPPDEFVTEPVQFNYDSATLTPQGQEAVGGVSDQLEEHPEVQTLWVEGHTCDLGSHAYNLTLSTQRAASCASELKKKHPDRNFLSQGYAYDHPVAPNTNESNRARNRRTQFFTSARAGKRPGELAYVSYK